MALAVRGGGGETVPMRHAAARSGSVAHRAYVDFCSPDETRECGPSAWIILLSQTHMVDGMLSCLGGGLHSISAEARYRARPDAEPSHSVR